MVVETFATFARRAKGFSDCGAVVLMANMLWLSTPCFSLVGIDMAGATRSQRKQLQW